MISDLVSAVDDRKRKDESRRGTANDDSETERVMGVVALGGLVAFCENRAMALCVEGESRLSMNASLCAFACVCSCWSVLAPLLLSSSGMKLVVHVMSREAVAGAV